MRQISVVYFRAEGFVECCVSSQQIDDELRAWQYQCSVSGYLSGFDDYVFGGDIFFVLREVYAAFGFVYYLSDAFAEVIYVDHAAAVVYVREYEGVFSQFKKLWEVAFAAGAVDYGGAHYGDGEVVTGQLLDGEVGLEFAVSVEV